MNEQKNNGRGIFYGVIGVATLVVAIIGATFAYFTASASNVNTITGNMATINLNLKVEKVTTVDEKKGGMIPMSNGMVEAAVKKTDADQVCVDDNGNAVCQIYKATLTNASSAGQFVDGYVALKGGSGTPTDFTSYVEGAKFGADGTVSTDGRGTTMRWTQVFVDGAGYSTAGDQILGAADELVTLTAIGQTKDATDQDPHNIANIRTTFDTNASTGVLATPKLSISGNDYDVIGKNYIRVSNHAWATGDPAVESFDREKDVTSALVYNHNIKANGTGEYYFVVWLSETGKNQTAEQTEQGGTIANPAALDFFSGNVTFVSAQGSEVSATFSGYTRVPSDQVNVTEP